MACAVHAVLVDPPESAELLLRWRLDELERHWSRFVPSSDITRLSAASGSWVSVSPETLVLVSAMKQGWRHTAHRYDPTLLAPLLAAGYVESVDGSGAVSCTAAAPASAATIEDVLVDPAAVAVRVPAGVGLDPGGIGKGLAADLVVAELIEAGAGGALVSIGGDLAAGGAPPCADGWLVAVEDPLDAARTLMTLAVNGGGVATSSTRSRTWVRDGHLTHHQLDSVTRAVAATDLAAVTVIAGTAWEAEVHATAALISGSRLVGDYLCEHELIGVAIRHDGVACASVGLDGAGDAAQEVS